MNKVIGLTAIILCMFLSAVTIIYVVSRLFLPLPRSITDLLPVSCRTACWSQIVPGKTTSNEALAILNADPRLSQINEIQPDVHLDPAPICWTFKANNRWFGCAYRQSTNPDIVNHLYLTLKQPSQLAETAYPFVLGDAVNVLGRPLAVQYYRTTYSAYYSGTLEMQVFFANDIAVLVRRPVIRGCVDSRLTPDSIVYGIVYNYHSDIPMYSLEALQWQGFKALIDDTSC